MTAIKIINAALIILLVLLLRKLVWCLRWLWCYYHHRETPEPIPFLPQRPGHRFEEHVQRYEDGKEE